MFKEMRHDFTANNDRRWRSVERQLTLATEDGLTINCDFAQRRVGWNHVEK